jgi:hypothetical protein
MSLLIPYELVIALVFNFFSRDATFSYPQEPVLYLLFTTSL